MSRPYTVLFDTSPETFLTDLLTKRGVVGFEEQQKFCEPNYDDLHSPWDLHTMDKAVERVLKAINKKEKIAIFSDYDCDGIPGAVVMHDFFKAIKYENFINVIPHRHYEGFGLSVDAVNKMSDQEANLIITIDCGTTDVESIEHANTLGIDVIVTDHHEPGPVLPTALAVVNPKIGQYKFPHLCGAAVAFKLAKATLERGDFNLISGYEKWWLDMVGLATIADMVPLIGENRIFAYYGLKVLRKSRRPGLQQLLQKNKIAVNTLTEDDIGFTIGPRINAASRMDAPEEALRLLTETDNDKSIARVLHLERLNTERKSAVAQMTKEIHARMRDLINIPSVLVLGNPLWRPSLVGLAANSLAKEYQRPVFLWGRDGNDVIKGSCRSSGNISVVTLMNECATSFIEYGGHHGSGGYSVFDNAIHTLSDDLNTAFHKLGHEAVVDLQIIVDAELTLDQVTHQLEKSLSIMSPFGVGHEKPLFAFPQVVPDSVQKFGKAEEHTKLIFKTAHGQIEAIAFFATSEQFTNKPKPGNQCTVLAHVESSIFMGRRSLRLRVVDII